MSLSTENLFEKFDTAVNNNLGWIHKNIYVKSIFLLIFASYPILARPQLPKFIESLFSNILVRFILISYIVYTIEVEKDYMLAMIVTIVFISIMHFVNKEKLKKEINNNRP
jgi:hypothetical protein